MKLREFIDVLDRFPGEMFVAAHEDGLRLHLRSESEAGAVEKREVWVNAEDGTVSERIESCDSAHGAEWGPLQW